MENVAGIADTGFLVALLNQNDRYHSAVRALYTTQHGNILVPQTVLAEVAYLVGKVNDSALISFLRGLPHSRFRLYNLTYADLAFVSNILEQYSDSRIDFVDATVMAVAEQQNIETIFTIDQRDFGIYRPRNLPYFVLLPHSL